MTCGLFLILHHVLCVLAIDPGTSTECTETWILSESGRYSFDWSSEEKLLVGLRLLRLLPLRVPVLLLLPRLILVRRRIGWLVLLLTWLQARGRPVRL